MFTIVLMFLITALITTTHTQIPNDKVYAMMNCETLNETECYKVIDTTRVYSEKS